MIREFTTERIKANHWLGDHVELDCWDDFESALDQIEAMDERSPKMEVTFAQAYLSGWFCNLQCPCGESYGPDDLGKAAQHFNAGHYETSPRS